MVGDTMNPHEYQAISLPTLGSSDPIVNSIQYHPKRVDSCIWLTEQRPRALDWELRFPLAWIERQYSKIHVNILRVCRQCYEHGCPILYGTNLFSFAYPAICQQFFPSIALTSLSQIRYIHVRAESGMLSQRRYDAAELVDVTLACPSECKPGPQQARLLSLEDTSSLQQSQPPRTWLGLLHGLRILHITMENTCYARKDWPYHIRALQNDCRPTTGVIVGQDCRAEKGFRRRFYPGTFKDDAQDRIWATDSQPEADT